MDKVEKDVSYKAVFRFARISPRKLRYMADLVRGKYADEALVILKFQPNRGARMIEKVILSARGNAVDRHEKNVAELIIKELCVDGGPMIKRFRPKARGSASVIKKRMSHIRITLE